MLQVIRVSESVRVAIHALHMFMGGHFAHSIDLTKQVVSEWQKYGVSYDTITLGNIGHDAFDKDWQTREVTFCIEKTPFVKVHLEKTGRQDAWKAKEILYRRLVRYNHPHVSWEPIDQWYATVSDELCTWVEAVTFSDSWSEVIL